MLAMAAVFLVFLSVVNPLTIWEPHEDPNLGLRELGLLLESTLDLHGFVWLSNMMSSFIFFPSSNHATVTEPDQYNAPAAKPANKMMEISTTIPGS